MSYGGSYRDFVPEIVALRAGGLAPSDIARRLSTPHDHGPSTHTVQFILRRLGYLPPARSYSPILRDAARRRENLGRPIDMGGVTRGVWHHFVLGDGQP